MASSKLMASSSPANPDLPRDSPLHSFTAAAGLLNIDWSKSFGSTNMDELFKNFYGDPEAFPAAGADDGGRSAVAVDGVGVGGGGGKTVDEVWKEIVAGDGGVNQEPGMTLENFLTKAGAVREEEVRNIPVMSQAPAGFGAESMMNDAQFQVSPPGFGENPVTVRVGNGIDGRLVSVTAGGGGGGCGGVGRGKRRAVEEPPMDKATQQKQRRMIKNRESAARSRERKQAYRIELESLVTQLEEENARLLREEAEQSKQRYKQLMMNLIPVEEKCKPPQPLRRVHSMRW